MKRTVRSMSLFIAFAIIAVLGLGSFVRLAPSNPADWHVDPALALSVELPPGQVVSTEGAAFLRLPSGSDAPADLLARLDRVAMATPRTTRLAGSVEEGRMTWISRSALWGFPDYTTAQITPEGLLVHARLRFGRSDLGVNAARLKTWLSSL